jgi:hypothetical protein
LFEFYQKDSDKHAVGLDVESDLVSVGKKTGVIEGTGWLESPLWEGKIQGKPALAKKLRENPKLYDQLRDKVLEVLFEREGTPTFEEPEVPKDE